MCKANRFGDGMSRRTILRLEQETRLPLFYRRGLLPLSPQLTGVCVITLAMGENNVRLVYSTDVAVPRKEKQHVKKGGTGQPPALQKVTVRIDRKGRGGKSVTVIEGLHLPRKQREDLLKQLKSGLGTGGTVKESALEIQGDHREFIMTALTKLGYRPKRSGG